MATIVIGAGVIGLMCARSLASMGRQVILLDKTSNARNKASWAGGGMAIPGYPWQSAPEIMSLVKRSYDLYPSLVQELLDETGIDIEWQTTGILFLDEAEYPAATQWAHRYHFPLQLLSAEQTKVLVPKLAASNAKGIWLPSAPQFRNPRLLKALDASIEQNSSIKRQICEVLNFVVNEQGIVGLQTTEGYLGAEEVVIAAGAWTGSLLALLQIEQAIFPVRGQMLLWEAPPDMLSCMIVRNGYYLIPRKDGKILAGSTLENVGFDNTTTEAVYDELYQAAVSLVPELAAYPVLSHWAGLRPGSPEGIPVVGKIGVDKGINNLWINAGHFRNGLLLAPATNELLIGEMLNGK
jgi:glycine oxidase